MKKLTPTQTTILENATERDNGNIEPLPNNVNPGVKQRVINGLLNRQLIDMIDNDYIINDAGWAAINKEKQTLSKTNKKPTKTPREGSKLAAIVALLKRDGGASLDELCQVTGWQQHTLRGTFAGTLKKRFKLTITSTKKEDEPRRYTIETHDNEQKITTETASNTD